MDPDDLARRLRDHLSVALDSPSLSITDLRRLTGGASRETWAAAIDGRPVVVQCGRPGSARLGTMAYEAQLLTAAAESGVPVAPLVSSADDDGPLGVPFLVAGWIEGESIARKIQRDEQFAPARRSFAADCGAALAKIHSIDPALVPGLPRDDQLTAYRALLDDYGDPHPAFELAFAWLDANVPPQTAEGVVHGDFRLGNLMIGPDGLRAVVDWELAHVGDPMEDLGWLCVRAWRFGGTAPVAGLGSYDDLFAAYEAASGHPVDPAAVRWWEVMGTLKWGIMCITQSRAHLDGFVRSVELAAIGRRVCENEHDLLELLEPATLEAAAASSPHRREISDVHDRPSADELLEAVREWMEGDVRGATTGRISFHTRVAANVVEMVRRELALGEDIEARHRRGIVDLGVDSEADLASAIRAGSLSDRHDDVVSFVAQTVLDKLRVANPKYSSLLG